MEWKLGGVQAQNGDFYETADDLLDTLCAIHASLKECGAEVIADGRLLDMIRRVNCFGLSLMNTDICQDAQKHVEAMDEITTYLQMGSYTEWDEAQRVEFLVWFADHKLKLTSCFLDKGAAMESTVDLDGHAFVSRDKRNHRDLSCDRRARFVTHAWAVHAPGMLL